ncbi:hypothetical protein F5I97DRAFT_1887460 [Phlebopus sp. FC_14]|nr:hypothetical protein F5I97DRAFT_1887460 [Phlebopus sp. FC_14]
MGRLSNAVGGRPPAVQCKDESCSCSFCLLCVTPPINETRRFECLPLSRMSQHPPFHKVLDALWTHRQRACIKPSAFQRPWHQIVPDISSYEQNSLSIISYNPFWHIDTARQMAYINPGHLMLNPSGPGTSKHYARVANPPVHPGAMHAPMPDYYMLRDQRRIVRVPRPLLYIPPYESPALIFSRLAWRSCQGYPEVACFRR